MSQTNTIDEVERLTSKLMLEAETMDRQSVQFLVASYYALQDHRIRAAAQMRSLENPSVIFEWIFNQSKKLENQIKRALKKRAESTTMGRAAMGVVGIGPVIAAALEAYIDIEMAPTVGHIWSYAGYNPSMVWHKGIKRPFNADLKVLCWKIGESFVKQANRDGDIYGHLLNKRKDYEIGLNDCGAYESQCAAGLERLRDKKCSQANYYKQGKLPPGHIHSRAKRWAVKLFLAHWHEAAYIEKYGKEPPLPYVFEHVDGHVHRIKNPML